MPLAELKVLVLGQFYVNYLWYCEVGIRRKPMDNPMIINSHFIPNIKEINNLDKEKYKMAIGNVTKLARVADMDTLG